MIEMHGRSLAPTGAKDAGRCPSRHPVTNHRCFYPLENHGATHGNPDGEVVWPITKREVRRAGRDSWAGRIEKSRRDRRGNH